MCVLLYKLVLGLMNFFGLKIEAIFINQCSLGPNVHFHVQFLFLLAIIVKLLNHSHFMTFLHAQEERDKQPIVLVNI